jgi:hypothetical protein
MAHLHSGIKFLEKRGYHSYFFHHEYVGEDPTVNNDFEYQCGLERLGLMKERLNELHSDIVSAIEVGEIATAKSLASYQECKNAYDRQLEEIDSYANYFSTDTYGAHQNKRAFKRAKQADPRTKGENKQIPKSSSSRKNRQNTRLIWSQSRIPMFTERTEVAPVPVEFESRSTDERKSKRAQNSKPAEQTVQTVQSRDERKFHCSMMPSYQGEKKGRSKTLKSLRQQKLCVFDEE